MSMWNLSGATADTTTDSEWWVCIGSERVICTELSCETGDERDI